MSKKEKKPKHSMYADRRGGGTKGRDTRSAATVRRLKMYNTRPKRDRKGKVFWNEFQSADKPCTRIPSDRRYFVNTRVIDQKMLEFAREELDLRMSSSYNVIMGLKKLPLSLLKDHTKRNRAHLRDMEVLEDAFGLNHNAIDYKSQLKKDDSLQEEFEQSKPDKTFTKENEEDRSTNLVHHAQFEKGHTEYIHGELRNVIDSSDVIVQVLDARDPQGTRGYHLEKHLKENCKQKHMVLLLNKCDLVPTWATKGWITRLSKEYPTLAFHASVAKPFGNDSLLSVLEQFARLKGDKHQLSVVFSGYPNVGKSSVINTLRTDDVCKVAPVPGATKVWQRVTLTERISLIDCPGVVYQNTDLEGSNVLNGVVRVSSLQDAVVHMSEVLKRVKKEHLERVYKIKDWENENDFLLKLCKLTGNQLKEREPDLIAAARTVLNDWQSGKIPFFVPPPKQEADCNSGR